MKMKLHLFGKLSALVATGMAVHLLLTAFSAAAADDQEVLNLTLPAPTLSAPWKTCPRAQRLNRFPTSRVRRS